MTRPIASLSSGLLARKGEARPAMRSQRDDAFGAMDDLGWNDMGEPAALPAVLAERRSLERRVVSTATAERLARETQASIGDGKAAFTLRLDGERHLRLRLASAVANESAQALVTKALDDFLSRYPQLDGLMAHLAARKG